MSQARQKGAGKAQHCLQLVHCWEVLWDPRSMSMSKRSPSVIEPLDDMWRCNKKQKFNNELDVYSMYVIIPFFLHKMLASHRQPTFRDRRWTKYSNLEERIGRHPLPQMSKLKNVCALCHAVGFDLFCPPVSTLGKRKQLWNLGGAGDKVVQGLNNLSIYGIMSIYIPTHYACHHQARKSQPKASLITVIVSPSSTVAPRPPLPNGQTPWLLNGGVLGGNPSSKYWEASWWFQPIWKNMLVKLDHFPK